MVLEIGESLVDSIESALYLKRVRFIEGILHGEQGLQVVVNQDAMYLVEHRGVVVWGLKSCFSWGVLVWGRLDSAAGAFEAVAFLGKDVAGFVAHVALQDDFPVFDRAAYAAAVFEPLAQGFQIGGAAYEASYQGHGLASPAFGIAQHAQILAGGFQGLGFGFFFVLVLEVGVGGIDHAHGAFLVHGVFYRLCVFCLGR